MLMMRTHRPGKQPPFLNSVFNWFSDDTSLLLKWLSRIVTTMTKRTFDLVLSVFGLVLLAPLLVAVAVMIKVESAGPVFYRGLRTGRFASSSFAPWWKMRKSSEGPQHLKTIHA